MSAPVQTLTRIAIPTPEPFPVGDVNTYLLGPAPWTLVDCGPTTEEAWDALVAGLGAAGCAVEALERLVLTHPHADHAGLAGRLRAASGCSVWAHPADHGRLLGDAGEWEASCSFLVEVCLRAGVPADPIAALRRRLRDMPRYYTPPDHMEALDEGTRLGQGAVSYRVLHTPGHSRGSVCLWDPESRLLLSGDTLLPDISSNAILEPGEGRFRQKSFLEHQQTLRRLAALGPRRVLPGHGRPGGDPRPLLAERARFHEHRAAKVYDLVHRGLRTPWEIAVRLFPKMEREYPYLGVSEVVGHLDLLAERGTVVFEGDTGPWLAFPAAPAARMGEPPAEADPE